MAHHLARVVVRADYFSGPLAHVFHFDCVHGSSDDPTTILEALFDAMDGTNHWLSNWCAALPGPNEARTTAYNIRALVGSFLDVPSPTRYRFAPQIDANQGTNSGESDWLPGNICAGVRWRTSAGVKNWGKNWLIINEDCLEQGFLDTTEVSGLYQGWPNYHLTAHSEGPLLFQGAVATYHRAIGETPSSWDWVVIDSYEYSIVPWQQGKRRYPLGG